MGELKFDSLRDLLMVMARNLEFTAARRLRKRSQRAIAFVRADLFIFEA
jgi:hypothetical protein